MGANTTEAVPTREQADIVLEQLVVALDDVLDMAMRLLYTSSDPPTREAAEAQLLFLSKARALCRAFEDGAQATCDSDRMLALCLDGDRLGLLTGAREMQREAEAHAAALTVAHQGAS